MLDILLVGVVCQLRHDLEHEISEVPLECHGLGVSLLDPHGGLREALTLHNSIFGREYYTIAVAKVVILFH